MRCVDIVVIGGGIQGVGVSQAAAAAGYSVILVERNQLAAGTSSKSSKLIHGGLRYLRRGEFRLVRESLRERDILLRLAPSLVHSSQFNIPVYKNTNTRPWQIRLGLGLYALLSGRNPFTAVKTLSKAERSTLLGLNEGGLQHVFRYPDAQTDDRLLTQAVAQSAEQLGAEIHTNSHAVWVRRFDQGYEVSVMGAEGLRQIRCRAVVNAAGPWVNQVAAHVDPAPPQMAIELVKGSHLVLETALSDQCFYLESPDDGRAVFALPWQGKTLLGTTEVPWHGSLDQVTVSAAETTYLLRTLSAYFPVYRDQKPMIVDQMAGLRVLPAGSGRATDRSREVQFVTDLNSNHGYLAIYGGKLTSYRLTAQKVLTTLAPTLGKRKAKGDTSKICLPVPAER